MLIISQNFIQQLPAWYPFYPFPRPAAVLNHVSEGWSQEINSLWSYAFLLVSTITSCPSETAPASRVRISRPHCIDQARNEKQRTELVHDWRRKKKKPIGYIDKIEANLISHITNTDDCDSKLFARLWSVLNFPMEWSEMADALETTLYAIVHSTCFVPTFEVGVLKFICVIFTHD